jgi:crossover junction endodeoxyribonuclease RuvC
VIVLGLDPGTRATGYGVVEQGDSPATRRLIECGVVRTDASAPLEQRLAQIFDAVSDLIARHRPAAVAVESVFVARNARSAVVLGHARGAALLAAAKADVPVSEYPPAMVKKTVVGAGAATKQQVQRMTARLLRLAAPPAPDDAADGVAIALTHCMRAARTFRRAVILSPGPDQAGGASEESRPGQPPSGAVVA